MRTILLHGIALAFTMTFAGAAVAVPELKVNGSANIDGDFSPDSSLSDIETGSPLVRTSISVSDALPGVFAYFALADITTPKLQVSGFFNNSGGDLGSELPLLAANAQLQDTISLFSASPDPYTVTAQLIVDGTLDVDGSNARVVAQLDLNPVDELNQTVSRTYFTTPTTPDERILTLEHQFTGDAEFDISSRLFLFMTQIDAGVSITADFSNTAIIVLTVSGLGAPGVTVESASGAFASNPVPIPAALPLMLSALGGLCWRARAEIRDPLPPAG